MVPRKPFRWREKPWQNKKQSSQTTPRQSVLFCGKKISQGDYWHLLQHQNLSCQGICSNQVSETHKAQHNWIYSNQHRSTGHQRYQNWNYPTPISTRWCWLLQQFLTCNKCQSKLVNNTPTIFKCSECGLTQLKQKCQSILFKTDRETTSYTLFNDSMHQLFQSSTKNKKKIEKTFEEVTEDDINMMLLTVETNVLFNEKKNPVQIVKDWTNADGRKAFYQQEYYKGFHYFFKGKKTLVFRNSIT